MIELAPNECRVLGVLVEKAQTTPAQYPLTLNALRNGCNQKHNRFPVLNLSEEQVIDALDALRAKGLVREVMLSDSRVPKYRHHMREVLEIGTSDVVVLAELLLRGPQTVGELRGRASRMHPLESLQVVESALQGLAARAPALVRRLAPAPGSRAPRFAQLLCPELHPEHQMAAAAVTVGSPDNDLEARLQRLEDEVAALRQALERLSMPSGHRAPIGGP